MIDSSQDQYSPDIVSPPGETLAETLSERGISPADLALQMGCSHRTVHGLVSGRSRITPDIAQQLERILGVPAHFWLRREQHYQEWRARQKKEEQRNAGQSWPAQYSGNKNKRR